MIATISVIAAITEKKKVQRSHGNHSPAIAEEWFHMIAMVAAIAEVFFSQRSQRSYGNRALICSWHILNVRIAYSETSI